MTPVEDFEARLSQKGYKLDFCSPRCRKIGQSAEATFYVLPIGGHDLSALYLFSQGKNGTFDLWEVEPTPFEISRVVESVEQRLPPPMTVKERLTLTAEKMA